MGSLEQRGIEDARGHWRYSAPYETMEDIPPTTDLLQLGEGHRVGMNLHLKIY